MLWFFMILCQNFDFPLFSFIFGLIKKIKNNKLQKTSGHPGDLGVKDLTPRTDSMRKGRSLKKTLLCVVICVNENSVALLFQDSLVLCSVKCNGWPFGTLLVWRSRSWVRARARALRRCCLDSFWARARTWSDQATQRKACGSLSANTSHERQETR